MDNNSDNNIKCIQINLQKSKTSTANLCKTIDDNNIDICVVQEPYVIRGKVVGFPLNYKILYCQNSDQPKSAIIIVNKSIQTVFIQSLSVKNITVINCEFNQKTITLFCAYFSPFDDMSRDLHNIQNAINVLKPNYYIICCDFNAHSRVWFNNRDDQRGEQINDFIAENNLILLNEESYGPTYECTTGSSTIYLTFININCSNIVNDWQILDIDSHSDHKYINFEMSVKREKLLFQSTFKYKTKSSDWKVFANCLSSEFSQWKSHIKYVNSCQKLNEYINDFSNKITQICEKSFKMINKNVLNKNSNKWWTEELSVLRHQVKNSRRRYQRCQTYRRQELINCYKLLKIQYKKLIIKTKIDKWESFVNDSTRDNPWGLVYSISRDKIYQQKVCEIITKNNTLVTDSTGIASTLLNELFPNDKPEEDNDYHKQLRQFCKQTDCNECDLPFTEQEVTDIILAQNPSKAPGVDGITADIIKKLHQMDSSLLTEVYNKCLSVESFPDFWKKSIVKVIPKSGKTDYTRSDSYRPINLLPVLGKIYEKLLINRVMDFLRKKNKLNEKQFGFSPQKSTEDALHSVISFVKNSFQKKGFSLIISLDISGAFNYCWFPKILSQLKVKECPKNLFYSFKSYFERREAEIWYLNKTFKRKITVGCPQGSSCGPFLWNISFDDIFDLTSDKDVVIECFADDTVIKTFADNISELEVKANEILEKVSKFAINNKLIFNVLKT
jgi:hypothetical protein